MKNKQTQEVKQTKEKRVNKKHFLIFNNGGILSITTPKDWARAHQKLFSGFDFSNSKNTPTVNEIENLLVKNKKFSRIENTEIVIHYAYKNI
jgi:hypothetical protein